MVEGKNNIIAENPTGYAICKFIMKDNGDFSDCLFSDVNGLFGELLGVESNSIIGKNAPELFSMIIDDSYDWISCFIKVAFSGEKINLEIISKDQDRNYSLALFSADRGSFVILLNSPIREEKMTRDQIEDKKIIKRQEAVLSLYNSDISSQENYLQGILNHGMTILESQYGYIFLYDENRQEFKLSCWTNGVMSECEVSSKEKTFKLESTGIWGEVVRHRKPIVINNFQGYKDKKGFPEGHIHLKNYMSVPVYFEGSIVAVVGIANKSDGYSEFDVNQLTILMNSAWLINETKKQIRKNEEERIKFNYIINQLPVIFCEFDKNGEILYINRRYEEYFQKKKRPDENVIFNYIPDHSRKIVEQRLSSLTPDKPNILSSFQIQKGNENRWMEWLDTAVFNVKGEVNNYYSIGYDITDRKTLEHKEKEELRQLRAAMNNHRAVMLFIEPETGKILYSNPAATEFYGYSNEELLNMSIQDINMMGEEKVRELRLQAANEGRNFFSFPHRLKNGEVKLVDVFSSIIEFDNSRLLYSIIFDVTDKEEAMKEIKYLAYHDHLTGVYNRRYFEESFNKLEKDSNNQVSLIIGDINGLKMVNDSYGHTVGDQLIKAVADNILELIPSECILSRIGGDEFVILLNNYTLEKVEGLTNLLEEELEKHIVLSDSKKTQIYLSVSFGYGIQKEAKETMDDLIKAAENHIYRRKYYNERSMRSHMVKAMMSTLFQKSEREQKHSQRVGLYCEAIARELEWDIEKTNRLRVAGSLHDIGKIGISEGILNKPGRLDDQEWDIMRQHSLKSAKILDEIEEYRDISNIVQSHHEKWDGSGYPNGFKENEIPLESRVIAVADAYDAMTHYRSYRNGMSKEEAIEELLRCSGSQFDPFVVDVFVNRVLIDFDESMLAIEDNRDEK